MWTCDENNIIFNRGMFSLSLRYLKLERMLLSPFSHRGGKGKCHNHQALKISTYLEEDRIHEAPLGSQEHRASLQLRWTTGEYALSQPTAGWLARTEEQSAPDCSSGIGAGALRETFWSTGIKGSFLLMGIRLRKHSHRTSPQPKLKMMWQEFEASGIVRVSGTAETKHSSISGYIDWRHPNQRQILELKKATSEMKNSSGKLNSSLDTAFFLCPGH